MAPQVNGAPQENGNSPTRKPRILLAACGSVAAIKFADLCKTVNEWAEVKAVATPASLRFIHRVAIPRDVPFFTDRDESSMWRTDGDIVLHTELVKWADIMAIAPLSSNTLAKIAGGLSDNLLTCIARAWDYENKKMFFAPSMSSFMLNNPFTARHLQEADDLGVLFIDPNAVDGAMAEISEINDNLKIFQDVYTEN